METRRDVFQAIADPNRRAILGFLSQNKLTLNQLAAHFDITRSAVSQHIKVLSECGLVVIDQRGRERFCETRLEKLSEVWNWLEQYKKFWEVRFDAMESLLNEIQNKKNEK